MERQRRRPEPAAIDITWVSCRGVKSSLPFHTPCLYASIFVVSSSAKSAHGHRRPHRVKTPTDRAGGENPEWDAPLRLYLPDASSPPDAAASAKNVINRGDGDGDVLLVKFELKAEVAVLGDVHTASAAVPVPDLVADGRTRRVSYQLVGPDGRQPNGVISFSYAFHERNSDDDDGQCSSDGEPATPPCATPTAVVLPPATIAAAPRLYPAIEWTLTEQLPVYPPVTSLTTAEPFAVADAQCYPPPPPVKPAAVYPPPPPVAEMTTFCGVYPPTVVEPTASALYPTVVDLAPVSYYPPLAPPPPYGAGCGYAASPGWGDRRLYS